jgi:hypothetical protein
MPLGNLVQAMKKNICVLLFLLCFFSYRNIDARTVTNVEELKEHVCDVLPTLYGWCSKEKALNFIDLVLEVQPKTCVEIGVFGGSSILPVASALKFLSQGVIIGIDPWDKLECIKYFDPIEDKAHLDWWGKVNLDHIYISYLNMLKRYKLLDYCITMKTTSEKAISEIDSIDILYIDGNHSEIVSTHDVRLYFPKVVSGGYIWLDDSLWPGTQQAKDLLLESCEVIKLIDNGNCILFKKR